MALAHAEAIAELREELDAMKGGKARRRQALNGGLHG